MAADGVKEPGTAAPLGGVAAHGETEARAARAASGANTTDAFPDGITFDKDIDGHSSGSTPGTPVPAEVSATQPPAGAPHEQEKPGEKMSRGRIALIMSALSVCLPFNLIRPTQLTSILDGRLFSRVGHCKLPLLIYSLQRDTHSNQYNPLTWRPDNHHNSRSNNFSTFP
jgi:hypothetical protein